MNRKSLILFIILAMLFPLKAYLQNKVYSGPFETGEATYEYHDSPDYTRIYNGKFQFKRSGSEYNSYDGYQLVEVTGKLQSNYKEGLWKYKMSTPFKNGFGGHFKNVECSFKNGLLDGAYHEQITSFNKLSKEYRLVYKEGVAVDSFYGYVREHQFAYENVQVELRGIIIRGTLNSKGNFDKEWIANSKTINGEKVLDIMKFKDGKLYFRIFRNAATGEVYDKIDSTKSSNVLCSFKSPEVLYSYGMSIRIVDNNSEDYIGMDDDQYLFPALAKLLKSLPLKDLSEKQDPITGRYNVNSSNAPTISSGLPGRKIVSYPSMDIESNENARIAVMIEVDSSGKVISAKISPRQTTTLNQTLRNQVLEKCNALLFTKGEGNTTGVLLFTIKIQG